MRRLYYLKSISLLRGSTVPAAFAYATRTTNQTFSGGTEVPIVCGNEVIDTDNCYDPSTGRFTAPRTGYYQMTVFIKCTGSASWSNGDYKQCLTLVDSVITGPHILIANTADGATARGWCEMVSGSVIVSLTAGQTLGCETFFGLSLTGTANQMWIEFIEVT